MRTILSRMSFIELLGALWKAETLKAGFALLLTYLVGHTLPVSHFVAAMFMLVLSDWVTGVWAAAKRNEKITSKGFRNTTQKLVFYMLAILLGLIIETTFFPDIKLVYYVAGFICITEFKSNIENIGTITGINILEAIKHYLPKAKSNETVKPNDD